MRVRLFIRRALFAFTFVLLAVPSPARSQTALPTQFRLAGVKFTGLSRYSEKQVLAAGGLQIGEAVTADQLQAAADRYAKSGAFDHVGYRYSSRGTDLNAQFELTETKTLISCVFDNFVWFSLEELNQTLQRRVPLYTDAIPQGGTTVKEVSDALLGILKSNGISGTIEQTPFYAKMGGTISGFLFRVDGVSMHVRTLRFPGAAGVSEKDLGTASSQVIGRDYSALNTTVFASTALSAFYHRRGYLAVHFDPPQATMIGSDLTSPSLDIAVAIPVAEGLQYLWDKAAWTGNRQLSTDDLTRLLGMRPGEVANQDQIDAGFHSIGDAYQKQGYIDAKIEAKQVLDDHTRLASYDVAIEENAQFHMGGVRFDGLPDRVAQSLVKKWRLKPGDVFDGTYPLEFMKKVAPQELAGAKSPPTSSTISLQRDPQNASVDVLIAFH